MMSLAFTFLASEDNNFTTYISLTNASTVIDGSGSVYTK